MKALVSSSQKPFINVPNSSSPWKLRKARNTLLPRAASQPRTRTQRPEARGFSGNKVKPVSINDISDMPKSDKSTEKEIPQEVFERMMGRIVVSVGAPMAAGLGAMKFFGSVKNQMDIPVWVQFATIFFAFGMSSVGLAYGALSSSWDADSKGSLLGFDEIRKNWVDMWREEDENNKRND